ncbi:uncharacterized protein LOC109827305 isoform X2 [Asparagus officinalis]|uniref:uncharacterized protein LOC109827305 isoform X2 n=1 Tax=Asparagus officinalis TaxID=4686 RepID=UPI00098E6D13|nr:uncharacterized protein LOC109827305 isoform X2 [Asparagus officinalis]
MARLGEYVDRDLFCANEEIEKTTQHSQPHEDELLEDNLSHIPCIDEPKIGKRKMQRFKPPSELKAKKQRTCGKCQGKGHNSRTCTAQTTSHVGSINEEEEEDPEDQEEEDEDVEEYYY